jgi:catechol 2,3-dioxygenase-like lactoylglutathione lyase family enzyme
VAWYKNSVESFMKFTGIKETCIYVKDLDKTQEFYQDKLGLKVKGRIEEMHVFFEAGRSMLLCFMAHKTKKGGILPSHGAEGCIHFALEVEPKDYIETKIEILQKGIKIEHEQDWGRGLHSFYFRDPDGHLVEVVASGIWDP